MRLVAAGSRSYKASYPLGGYFIGVALMGVACLEMLDARYWMRDEENGSRVTPP